ncbi:cellulase family glycosylhydrolase [Ruania alkalisoli]|uniref:Cellulase family glycosylhydrolase n=1 Tax=Ruania alkalisoli TaxID=2779775 RepID=A0A7M1SRX8_9MICO|nr:cellulase family glycosylhydrolase [Ruania alkalisoli]QOR70330.1 cellulase family glycosylhydrolase [Ruania alkalisoli]
MRIGVNYVPSQHWYYCWLDWDATSIARDLDAVAALEVDHIRIQCIWPWFQPNPAWVSPVMLDRLEQLLDLAGERDLQVCVTVLNGWLSGFDFRPAWLLDTATETQRNIFTDPWVIAAQQHLLAAVCERTADHPALWGYDVGNEPNVLTAWNPADEATLDAWCTAMVATISEHAPRAHVVIGVDQRPWINDEPSPSPELLASTGSMAAVHAWPWFSGALTRFGEQGSLRVADFLVQVALASQPDGVRPVWVQELGVAPEWVSDPTGYAGDLLAATVATPSVEGITWWCSHDVDRRFSAFANLEYELGLLTVGNELKPIGKVFAELAEQVRSGGTTAPEPRRAALVLPPDRIPDLDVMAVWLQQPEPMALVRAERRHDAAYLAGRGIEQLVALPAG